jgi:2-amino-4-hydroxy-6-hydroxymethyldihydropteridine diphosphokinase
MSGDEAGGRVRRETRVAIGLGSNLGDRLANLDRGVRLLADRRIATDIRISSVFETDPVGLVDQPGFLNACLCGRTRLRPMRLLAKLQDVERAAGRDRTGRPFGPRTLDLDILLYDDLILSDPELTIPHPRMRERAFVLVPLAEIAPEWEIPATGSGETVETVAALAGRVDREGVRQTCLTL